MPTTSHRPHPGSDAESRVATPYTQDVRFAVVLYGGVSLAIYINGVAQEMLNMVRATAADGDRALLPHAGLTGTQRVYRKLGQLLARGEPLPEPAPRRASDGSPGAYEEFYVDPTRPIRTRFVIDVLSGTSAGGINAIFLAKALANEQSMDKLKQLWVEEGDIGRLLNDAASVRDLPGLARQLPPRSLLNGQRMYLKLLNAFRDMDGEGKLEDGRSSRLVEDLDLFVTTTDVRGAVVPLRLSDKVVMERRYRRVFQFTYRGRSASGPASNFAAADNGLLAFAARCTSAFPFAFEPMEAEVARRLQHRFPPKSDAETQVDSPALDRLFRGPVRYREPDPSGGEDVDFAARSYVDGGYLDNKPFSYAIDALAFRHAPRPVDRKLIYVEPSPEHPELEAEPPGPPDALANVQAALLGVPRYETIREDLQRVLARNRLLERVESILEGAAQDLARPGHGIRSEKFQLSAAKFKRMDLGGMIRLFGPGYGGYQRLKVAAVTDFIAGVITGAAGLDPASDDLLAVRYLVREWRDAHYDYYPEKNSRTKSFNAFLMHFDLEFRLRRLAYARARLDDLAALDDGARRLLARAGQREPQPEELPAFQEALAKLKKRLERPLQLLAEERDFLCAGDLSAAGPQPARARRAARSFQEAIRSAGLDRKVMEQLLEGPTEEDRRDYARWLLGARSRPGYPDLLPKSRKVDASPIPPRTLERLATMLRMRIREVTRPAADHCRKVLEVPPDAPRGAAIAIHTIAHCYNYFEVTDLISYPALYATSVGDELDQVEVLRISPEDTQALLPPGGPGSKLAGTMLGHFGAFLDAGWRQNDILWGRLDGAERLIEAVVPASNPELRRSLIREAHLAILAEEFRPVDRDRLAGLLAEFAMGHDPDGLLASVLGSDADERKAKVTAAIRTAIENEGLYDYFAKAYKLDRDLDPGRTLNLISRATAITGDLLEEVGELSGKSNPVKSLGRAMGRIGHTFTTMVSFALPGGLRNASLKHSIALVYLLELLMLGGAMFLRNDAVLPFAIKLLVLTIVGHTGLTLLESYIRWPRVLRVVGKWVVGALAVAVVALAVYGATRITGPDLKSLLGPIHGRLNLVLVVVAILALLPPALRSIWSVLRLLFVHPQGRRAAKRPDAAREAAPRAGLPLTDRLLATVGIIRRRALAR